MGKVQLLGRTCYFLAERDGRRRRGGAGPVRRQLRVRSKLGSCTGLKNIKLWDKNPKPVHQKEKLI